MKAFRTALKLLLRALMVLAFSPVAFAAPNHRDYAYDMSGRLWRAMDAEGTLLSYTYDAVGNITKIGRDKVDPNFNILGTLPLTGGAGDVVTIQGNGFDTNLVGNTVQIGGTEAVVVSVDPNGRRMVIKVPWGAESGPISVTVDGQTTTAPDTFTIIKYGDVGIRGSVVAGETVSHPLELLQGQAVLIRLADASRNAFHPDLVLKDPDGVQAAVANAADVAALSYTATTTGTYDIMVSDRSGQSITGEYVLYYAVAPGSNEGGALNVNLPLDGTIDLGDLDSFTFDASAGQGVELRVADLARGAFYPYFIVYGPTGATVGSNYNTDVAALSLSAPVSGTYTVVVADASTGHAATGDYKIYFTRGPGSSDGGTLDPNLALDGSIDLGDVDAFTFDVAAGQGVELRVADLTQSAFVPYLRVFDPSGTVVANDYRANVAAAAFKPAVTGTYTAVVFDYSSGQDSTGTYKIYYARAPGSNDGGALDANVPLDGTIDLGDVDAYTFNVTAGQGVELRVADVAQGALVPYLRVFDPNGVVISNDYRATVATASFKPSVSGTYTAVVFDYSSGYDSTGAYKIYYSVALGSNDGGTLDVNTPLEGAIDLGDVDAYTFNVTAGQGVELRVADVAQGAFVPYLRVFDPSGTVVSNDYRAGVAVASFKPSVTGTYTAAVFDYSSGYDSTGAYKIYYTRAPGSNDGGKLNPNTPVDGTIELGDMDAFTFDVTAGEGVELRVADTAQTGFVPYLRVFDPSGTVVSNDYRAGVAVASFKPSVTGTYTAAVFDYSSGYDSTGAYQIFYTQAPGSSDGGKLDPNLPVDGTIELGDVDAYTFDVTADQRIEVRVADTAQTAFVPYLRVFDPNGTVIANDYRAGVAVASFKPAVSGTYTAVVFDYSSGYDATGNYKIYYTQAPGSNDGALDPNLPLDGVIDLGDVDAYTFDAVAGESYLLRVADQAQTAFVPYLRVVDPTGTVVANDYRADVAGGSFKASVSGRYTAMVFDYSSGYDATGAYKLYFTRAPGSSDGVLATAAPSAGSIELGDIDAYTFTVAAGAKVQVLVTDVNANAFVPYLTIYGPTGTAVDTASGVTTATAAFTASTAGTYTAVLFDNSSGYDSIGDYTLALTVN